MDDDEIKRIHAMLDASEVAFEAFKAGYELGKVVAAHRNRAEQQREAARAYIESKRMA
jgi:hypothetical protein